MKRTHSGQRKKREDPQVLTYKKIAHTSKNLAKLTEQTNQYKALVKQILEITEQPDMPVTLTEENIENIIKNIIKWLSSIDEIQVSSSKTRDEALITLRKLDVLDDDALKGAALILTESETRLAALEGILSRFARVVRHKTTTKTIESHTTEWLKRFFSQWVKTNTAIVLGHTQFKELIESLPISA